MLQLDTQALPHQLDKQSPSSQKQKGQCQGDSAPCPQYSLMPLPLPLSSEDGISALKSFQELGTSILCPCHRDQLLWEELYVQVGVDNSTGPVFLQQLAATFNLALKGNSVLSQRWSYPAKEILTLQPLIDLALFSSALKLLTLWCNLLIFISNDSDCLEGGWLEQSLYFCSELTLNNVKALNNCYKNSKSACSHLRMCHTALTVLQHLLSSHFSISKSQQLQLQDAHCPKSWKCFLPFPWPPPSQATATDLKPNLCPKLWRAEKRADTLKSIKSLHQVVTIQAKALSLYNTNYSIHLMNQNLPMNTAWWL